ncbi:MAG: hydroxyacid dehydrogenase [Paracoccaceae bacterium]
MSNKPKLAFSYDKDRYDDGLNATSMARLAACCDILDPLPLTSFTDARAQLVMKDADILITGWASPSVNGALLDIAPNLKLVAHLAATVKYLIQPEIWQRGVTVTSAVEAVALPVVEFTMASIVFAGKNVLQQAQKYRRTATLGVEESRIDIGLMGQCIGIIGASRVGLPVIDRLRQMDVEVLVYDPFFSRQHAAALGAEKTSLEDLLRRSDIVSLHAPITEETKGMIDDAALSLIRDGATLINTARGVLIDEPALIKHLETGRISAILDVTHPEPPVPNSPLYTLPNVLLTPHIAGPIGSERQRMFDAIVNDIERFTSGKPLLGQVDFEAISRLG